MVMVVLEAKSPQQFKWSKHNIHLLCHGEKVTNRNYIGRTTKTSLSSVLLLPLAQVHCCPVRIGPSILLLE